MPRRPKTITSSIPRAGFTLIELLVVVAVVAVLVGVMLPALGAARGAAHAAVCSSNLRQAFLACRLYADANRGAGPAIGQPYGTLPNWALVVQEASGLEGDSAGQLYTERGVLICPAVNSAYGRVMTRTYAMNATGHADKALGDPDSYDDPARPAHIRFDLVQFPDKAGALTDSLPGAVTGDAPPPTRSASVIDFRNPSHVSLRLAALHGSDGRFNAARFDGSVALFARPPASWTQPLP